MERARPPWSVLTIVILALSVGVLVVFLAVRATTPAEQAYVSIDHWDWSPTGTTVQSVATETSPADRHLADDDAVLAIDGVSLEDWASAAVDPSRAAPFTPRPGAPLRFAVIRGGAPTTVVVAPAPFPIVAVFVAGWPLVLFSGLLVLVSGFIALRRPDLPVARVLIVGSVGNLASALPWQLGLEPTDLVRGGPGLVSFALTGPINLLFWAAALHIIVVFQAQADQQRRRWAVWAIWFVPPIALVVGVLATRVSSSSILAWIDTWTTVQSAVVGVLLVLGLVGTVMAYRRAHPALRHDVRWIALAFAVAAAATLGFVIVPILLTGKPLITRPALALLALPIPVALAVAVVRDRLFEIDVLRQSRETLVVAREDERRRLRRDLHDGLGPSLAAMTVKLGVARLQVRADPAATEALLDEITGETQAAIAEVRRLASALRPPALDEVGLVEAIRRRADSFVVEPGLTGASPRIDVVGPAELPSLSAAAEVAAYRIAVEAMTNVVRHAAAQTCRVTIGVGETLDLEIVDDGAGLPPGWRMGIGTAAMRERAAELGGRCTIERRPGGGTRVDASLPLSAG